MTFKDFLQKHSSTYRKRVLRDVVGNTLNESGVNGSRPSMASVHEIVHNWEKVYALKCKQEKVKKNKTVEKWFHVVAHVSEELLYRNDFTGIVFENREDFDAFWDVFLKLQGSRPIATLYLAGCFAKMDDSVPCIDRVLNTLEEKSHRTAIQYIDLCNNHGFSRESDSILDAGLSILTCVQHLPNLMGVRLDNNFTRAPEYQRVFWEAGVMLKKCTEDKESPFVAFGMGMMRTEEKPDAHINGVFHEAMVSILDTASLPSSLKHLYLSNCSLNIAGAEHVAEVLRSNHTLQEIELDNNAFGIIGFKHIATGMRYNTNLRRLSLYGCQGREGVAVLLRVIVKHHNLRYLNLGMNNARREGTKAMASLLSQNRHLKEVNFSYNFAGPGASLIAEALLNNETLQYIDLAGNTIPTSAVPYFAHLIGINSTLREINLSTNQFLQTDGNRFYVAVLKNNTLTSLDLSHTVISQRHIARIGEVLRRNRVALAFRRGSRRFAVGDNKDAVTEEHKKRDHVRPLPDDEEREKDDELAFFGDRERHGVSVRCPSSHHV
eukprot:Clim_evm1s163 gene=Clim_evmTU1s163